ncbi:hypothetical protein H5410_004819 [Solanum commersonii]|uniref:Uncharacterized protein n=1 Tax=Solanum commersonii TaxID=4109 RepID=A0A9J6A4X5_SOLCO|nr:hypothetical protein H5410_004819 [Solanum commersonii]
MESESSKLLCGSSSKVETTTPITFVLLLSTFAAACGSIAYGFAVGYSSPAEAGIMDDLGLSLANFLYAINHVHDSEAQSQRKFLEAPY